MNRPFDYGSHAEYRVAVDEQADGVAREFTMFEGEVGRCSCGTVFFSTEAAIDHECAEDDDSLSITAGVCSDPEADLRDELCPGCRIAFNADRVRDRQAKGFDRCIDCMIAEGREIELDPQDAEDYWSRDRREDGGDPSASSHYSSERMAAAGRID